jgi:hypothetical protein
MLDRICTTDPITLNDIPDPYGKPYVVEGVPDNNITIYFESEENRKIYLDIPAEHLLQNIRCTLDNPTHEFIDEG